MDITYNRYLTMCARVEGPFELRICKVLPRLSLQGQNPRPPASAPTMAPKRDFDGQPKFADWWTVNVLGAHAGAEIRVSGSRTRDSGLASAVDLMSVAGVKLKVVSGAVLPYQSQRQFARDVWDKEGQEGWAAKLGAKFGVSTAQAEQLIAQFEPYAEPGNREGLLGWTAARPGRRAPQQIDGRDPLTVRILEVGAWWRSPQIVKWVKW